MKRLRQISIVAIVGMFVHSAVAVESGESKQEERVVPTHADAAVIFAKFSGLFDRYVADDASLNDCVSFLNKSGIYFGLLEVINGTVFTTQDCARVMGQMNLLFSGEADFVAGKVRLPVGVETWEEFCILNEVKYTDGYENLKQTLQVLHDLS